VLHELHDLRRDAFPFGPDRLLAEETASPVGDDHGRLRAPDVDPDRDPVAHAHRHGRSLGATEPRTRVIGGSD
jgi:hypothetical protein